MFAVTKESLHTINPFSKANYPEAIISLLASIANNDTKISQSITNMSSLTECFYVIKDTSGFAIYSDKDVYYLAKRAYKYFVGTKEECKQFIDNKLYRRTRKCPSRISY